MSDFNFNGIIPSLNVLPSIDNNSLPFSAAPVTSTAIRDASIADTLKNTNTGPGIFKGTVIPGLQAFNGLANTYLGFQGLQLTEDQIDLSKQQYDHDLASRATNYNMLLENSKRGAMVANGEYKDNPEAFKAALHSFVKANSIKGSAA